MKYETKIKFFGHFARLSFGKVKVPSPKIVINLLFTSEKIQGEPFGTAVQTNIDPVIFIEGYHEIYLNNLTIVNKLNFLLVKRVVLNLVLVSFNVVVSQ